ncbi:MAG: CPBP family intramembrane metalloprotease, partial [Treponema sp.]|nr:CPBP family intramembrane metalloprotease [Treponema sp.]
MTGLTKKKALAAILISYIICSIVKYIEFFFIQTDQTFIADNVICKIFCIIFLALALKFYKSNFGEIGFDFSNLRKNLLFALFGFGLGIATFALSYLAEIVILLAQGKSVQLGFYVTNFALSGATNSVELSLSALLICIAGNIINVVAEEGLFRGLFLHLAKGPFGFKKANFIQALLFGTWHLVTVALEVKNGTMNIPTAAVMAVGYIVLAGILALEWGTCVSMTGVLWAGLCEHFFNNFIGNTLHVITESGTDELQIARIV